ncbi:hypothetical protein ACHAXN_011339 [Cyclotella atomus]
MKNSSRILSVLLATIAAMLLVCQHCHVDAFHMPAGQGERLSTSSLGMAPRFDKATQKWFPTNPETEGPAAGQSNSRFIAVTVSLEAYIAQVSKIDTTQQRKSPPPSHFQPRSSLPMYYRAGPVPFFQRIVNTDTYEQAVLKYMAQEGCDRMEAQGNMDAFLENPQDWTYQKMQEKNGAVKKDYVNANMEPKQVVLSTVWAGVVAVFGYDLVTGVAEGRYGRADGDLLHGNIWNLPF